MEVRSRAKAKIAFGLVFGTVVIVGCSSAMSSGGGDGAGEGAAAAPETSAVPTSVAPTTTVPPTSTLAPATTVEPSTTTSTTTTTTLPPSVVAVPVVDPPLAAIGSSSGGEASRIQQRLVDLGFWISGVDGSYGLTTHQAVMAFQKYIGLDTTGSVDQQTAEAMTNMELRPHARANSGSLVEIDKGKQLLFFVIDGRTEYILNTSTGNGESYTEDDQNTPGETISGVSLTPNGLHEVNRQREEGWWEGDLGEIYRPKYFVGGVAVHGSNSIPNYPASHGCVRVSVPAMDWIWDAGIFPINTPVWVHEGA